MSQYRSLMKELDAAELEIDTSRAYRDTEQELRERIDILSRILHTVLAELDYAADRGILPD